MKHYSAPVGEYMTSADIRVLPMIDMNHNELSCIYSALAFVVKSHLYIFKYVATLPCETLVFKN